MHVAVAREELGAKLGNLSCVLHHLGMLTSTGQVRVLQVRDRLVRIASLR